jgi:cyclic dehypoxanthinyl futalosine synthase
MSTIDSIADKILNNSRLTDDEAVYLFRYPDITQLGILADYVRWKKHPERVVTYNIGRNINYTNVCWVRCSFCAFYRPPGSEEGYLLPKEKIFEKIQELVDVGGTEPYSTEILMQGGLNPKLTIDYYEDLLRSIKERFPVHIHSFSATEILYIAHISHLSINETLRRLRQAGLDSLPGAGAEILDDDVRLDIAFRKDTTEQWLDVHRTAHRLGMRSTATMMYGSYETVEQRVNHLRRIRELQDETGGFTAFIAWSFQPNGTALAADTRCNALIKATGYDYLRTVAVARLYLDNIENLQASWVTQGPKIAQISLKYGVNDFGSTMMEENVVSAAGTKFVMPIPEIERLIHEAGYELRRRNTRYEQGYSVFHMKGEGATKSIRYHDDFHAVSYETS